MAEICLNCWNKMNNTNHKESRYIISKELDLCECCGEWTKVIICERKHSCFYNLCPPSRYKG